MKITRTIVTSVALLATAGMLVGCSDDEPESTSADSSSQSEDTGSEDTASADSGEESAPEETAPEADGDDPNGAGDTTVQVDGKTIDGFDGVQCVEQGDTLTFASTASTDPSMAGTLSAGASKVESLAITTGTLSMVVTSVGGTTLGSADVSADGDTYTITGTAVGTDTDDLTKQTDNEFEVVVTC